MDSVTRREMDQTLADFAEAMESTWSPPAKVESWPDEEVDPDAVRKAV